MANTNLASASAATAAQQEPFKPKPPFFFELSRLMVVAINSSGRLIYKAQTKPNGPWQADWTTIDNARIYAVMAAGLTGDGRVAIVAQPTSGPGVLYIDEKPNTPTQEWNAPVDLGRPGATGFINLATTFDADGRVEVFGVDGSNTIWWKYQNPNRIVQQTRDVPPPPYTVNVIAPPLTPWSNWFQIPGGLVEMKALRNADGRIILFGLNSAGQLFRNEQKVARALQPNDWAGWVRMDDAETGPFQSGTMAPSLDRAGAVNLFVITRNSYILHARQAPPCTATWTGWTTPGIIREGVTNGVRAVAAARDGDDHLVVVATDVATSTSLWHNMTMQLDVDTQQWSGWTAVSPFSGGPPRTALDYNADGRLSLFSHVPPASSPNPGALSLKSQMAFDSTEWEWTWTLLAADSIRQYAVVRDLTPPT